MSETRAVTLETQVDTAGARAGFNEIAREAGSMAQAVARSSEQAGGAIGRIGDGGSAATRKAEAAQRTLIASIERTTLAAQSGGRATAQYYELLGRQRGVDPAVLQPYLAQLREIEQLQARAAQTLIQQQAAQQSAAEAARTQAAAQREVAQAQAGRESFLNGLREQVALFGKSADEALRYRAAQLGATSAAEPLIAQLRSMREAQEQAAAAAQAMERAQRDASQVNTSRDAYLNGLREEIALFGKSAAEVQLYRAAQLNAANSAAPLIAQLRTLREAEEQAATAARTMEQAQRDALQMNTSRDAFLSGLREQVALFGRSADEALKYRAAQLGAANAADPMIAQLRALRTAQEQANQAQRDQSGRDAFVAGLQSEVDAIGRTRIELLELRAAQLGVTQQATPFIARLREAERGLRGTGISAAQTAAAMRMVPAQMTDIIVSLQGGQAPMTVLLQQGGQLKDSFGGAGAAAKALGGYVLQMVNPYTAAAAAVAGLTYAYSRGREEVKAYNQTLVTSGNMAGTTAGQLSEMALSISKVSGNRGEAAAVLNGLVQTGQVQAKNLQQFAQAAIEAQKVMGRGVEETTADFEKIGRAPLQGLDEIDRKYHFIDASTRALVKSLLEQGKTAEAANTAQQAYADGITTQKQKVLDGLSDWERGWIRIKEAIGGAWDKVTHFRADTGSQEVEKLFQVRTALQEGLNRAVESGDKKMEAYYKAEIDANQELINKTRERGKVNKDASTSEADDKRAQEVLKRWQTDENLRFTRAQQMQKELAAAAQEGIDNHLKDEDVQNRLAVIRVKYNDVYVQGIQMQIDALNRRAAIEDLIAQREIRRIAARRAAGDITEEAALNQTAERELAQLDRRRARLQQQLDALRGKRDSLPEQKQKQGEIDEIPELKQDRREQLEQDLATLKRQREEATTKLSTDGLVAAQNERDSLLANIKTQKEYNEEIGLSSEQVMDVRARRAEDLAVLKDQTAEFLAATEGGAALAQVYRDQAAALRAGSAAEREGFVKSRDPYVNLRMSLSRYVEESQNAGGMIGDALTGAFRSAEDAFATFVSTGKLSFRDLATSIIADFARIQAKSAIGGFASSLLGSMGSDTTSGWGAALMKSISGARAAGGPVNAGLSYLVGEKGPEIFTPSSSGAITPNHMIGAGAGGVVNISFNTAITDNGSSTQTSGDTKVNSKAAMDALHASFQRWLGDEMRQGGSIWKMRMGR